MKRFHVHVNVEHLDASIAFYTTLFGTSPAVVKEDYAKWMLDDPRINFAISERGRVVGVDHLGLQADDDEELAAIGARLQSADAITLAEKATTCCYARSDKFWAEDPQGVRWESFRTHGESTTYTSAPASAESSKGACCGPSTIPSNHTPSTSTSCC